MSYTELASGEVINQTLTALKANNFEGLVLDTKEQALNKIKELIPRGASVMNGSSRTLEQIGFVDLLKSGNHGWDNLHEKVLAEKDPVKQSLLRRQAVASDYYLGSAHAITRDGQLMFASNSGSQLPHLAFTSPNIILVVGTHKIVKDLADGNRRIQEQIIPLEDVNMMNKYGVGTAWNKSLILHKENPMFSRKVLVIFVKEALGF